MDNLTPREYLASKGREFRESGGQLVIKVCQKCGDGKFHCYMDPEEGAWHCKKCGEGGNLVTLRRDLGDMDKSRFVFSPPRKKEPPVEPAAVDKYHAAFITSPEAILYMAGRGIEIETCQKYRVCYKPGWIGYPTFRDGKCIVIKWRSLPPAEKKFMREPPGAESLLFNGDCLKGNPREAIITEGEIDALTLLQAGFSNVVSIPNGASNLPDEAVATLKKVRKVYLAYDPDIAGRRGAEAAAKRIGETKCYGVDLPEGADINDFIRMHTPTDFSALLEHAKLFSEPHVVDYEGVWTGRLERLECGEAEKGLRIGLRPVAELLGRLRPGNVYINTAYPKAGKTTLGMNVAWDLAKRGIPTLFYCLEMTPEEVAESLLMHIFQTETLTREHWEKAYGQLMPPGWLFGWNPKPLGWKQTLDVIREAVRERGVQFLVVDNFHYLVRAEKDPVIQEALVSMEIKALAVELNIPVWLIVHPRKQDTQSATERAPTFQDLRGSAALAADATAVLILHRPTVGADGMEDVETPRSPLGFLRADASRFTKGGQRRIFFDAARQTFREPTAEEITEYAPRPKGQGKRAFRYRGNAGADFAAGESRS